METTVTKQFIILSLHPEKGRIIVDQTHFRYSLTGAVIMDFLNQGEITVTDRRVSHSFRKNGDNVHDTIAEIMERPVNPKKISYWISRLSMKSRFVYRETAAYLVSRGILRHEKRYFLGIIPYNRYYQDDTRFRREIIEGLRNVLLRGSQSTKEQMMMIGLLTAARAHKLIAVEPGEKRTLRIKCKEFMKKEDLNQEVKQVIRDIQSAISASIAASAAASSAAGV